MIIMTTHSLDQAVEILSNRAEIYGGDISDILNETPTSMWDNPDELVEFWEGRDLSHIFAQSTHPWLSDDWSNIMPEDPSINRGRGADMMTPMEETMAQLDNEIYADVIDMTTPGDSADVLAEVIELALS